MDSIDPVFAIDWEKESYPVYGDFVFLPAFAIFFPAARFFLDSFVFENCARRCILGKGKNQSIVGAEERKKLEKFKESAWKLVYFLSAELLALCVSYNEPWFTDTRYFWIGPGEQVWPDQMTKLKLKILYMFGGGFYIYSIFALLFWETRRKDFVISMVHHVSTLTLITLSYIFRFTRVGSVVLAIHDATDVFLEVAKMSRYSGYQGFANFAFVLFVIMWVLLRLLYFSFSVLRSTSYEVIFIFDVEKYKLEGPLFYYSFNTLLFCLLVLNIYWWILMCRMIIRQIKASGELGDDIRSDSEGEDEHAD